MAIVWGEYGPYDDTTGQPVYGNETVPIGGSSSALPDSAYIVKGKYRLPNVGMGGARIPGGQLEVMGANGWEPVTAATAPAGYDPRQDSAAQGSNERGQFEYWFKNSPADSPITQAREWAVKNGYQEPPRKNEGTLGAMFSNIAPYAALMAGGIGAMGGFGGMLGSANAASLAAGDSMAGLIPAGELGAWTGAGAAGTTAGSGAMDLSNLGDLWNTGGSASNGWDFGPLSDSFMSGGLDPVSGMNLTQSMVPSGWDFGPLSDALMNGGTDPVSGMTLEGMSAGGLPSSMLNSLKSLFSGSGSGGSTDLMKLLGGLGAAGLGAYASNKQTSALEDMAGRYEGYGAPYRQKLSDLYANPDSFLNSNEVRKPVQQGTDMLMRSLSMQGNPFGSGNALQQGQSYASDQLFGKLGQEKDRLAGFGGLATYNAAAPGAATNAIGSSGNTYNAIGSGLGNIFNPPKTEAQTMADFMKAMKG